MTLPAFGALQRINRKRLMVSISLQKITPDSPGVGHCATVLSDNICRSGLRTFDEIARRLWISEGGRCAAKRRIAALQHTGFRPAPE